MKRKAPTIAKNKGIPGQNGAALLWDESFLWGLMAYKSLRAAGLQFELIRSEDIRSGVLDSYALLFVPGGWSSNKMKTLGPAGAAAIRNFVNNGGNYLGFCGGAGLATLDGIGLLDIRRRPTKDRVPSFSGRIKLGTQDHLIWENITDPVFHAWWPPQFDIRCDSIKTVATYAEALPESFSSDLNVGDIEAGDGWHDLEKTYQINLDPGRLYGQPAVIEGTFGNGKVLLSLLHFDTPDDRHGTTALINLWKYLSGREYGDGKYSIINIASSADLAGKLSDELKTSVRGLIDFGIRNFLWFRRNTMLLQWRRGVRGLEYCSLYVLVREIASLLQIEQGRVEGDDIISRLNEIRDLLIPFVEKAKTLLLMERLEMQKGYITYEKCDNPEVQMIRTGLFGRSKSYGGVFKEVLDEVDALLYILLKENY